MKRISFAALATLLVFISAAAMQNNKTSKTSNLKLTQLAGHQLFFLKACQTCHSPGKMAKDELTPILSIREPEWFSDHVDKESKIVLDEAGSKRRQRKVLAREVEALSAFLSSSEDVKMQIEGLPETVRQGAYLSYQNLCTKCHTIAGEGKEVGPELTFIADKKGDRAWHISNLKNPQQFAAESPMPAFEGKLSDAEIGKIVDYILTLRK